MQRYCGACDQRGSQQRWFLFFFLGMVLPLAFVTIFSQNAAAACDPNTEVCSQTYTFISTQQYKGASGSARVSFYPTPKEKGNRKGVSLWVFGFGPKKAAKDCLNKDPGSGEFVIGDPAVPFPVWLGFDHYSVDFCDPSDYLQRNALVVRELILEKILPTLQSGEKFSVVGNSMGGLITRYVLTQLEAEGIDHHVNLWITNDSPHKGAYIPLSIQFLGSIAAVSGLPGVSDELALLDSPGARQMLLAHHLSPTPGQPHPDHTAFFNELMQLGDFPRSPGMRTVAIASGAGTGSAAHHVEGATLSYPIPDQNLAVSAPYIENGEVKWKTWLTVTLRGKGVLNLIPLTQTQQTVLRAAFDGSLLINGDKLFTVNPDSLTTSDIAAGLVKFLKLPAFVPDSILNPVAQKIRDFITSVISPIVAATATVQADFPYEGLAGGLRDSYSAVGGKYPHTFIPTFSSLDLDLPPGTDLTNVADLSSHSPFDEVVFQSQDRTHTFSESDVQCREERRLAGVPYITQLEPVGTRKEGDHSFTLTVVGGNFTPQTIVSWQETKLPTTYVSATQLTAVVSANLQVATTQLLWPDQPNSPTLPAIVSVNNYDAQGNLASGDFYADQANCKIGIVVQENDLKISPTNPTTRDQISATFASDAIDGCHDPHDPQVAISGNQITITTTNTDQYCIFVILPYEVHSTLGPLPAGAYDLTLDFVKDGTTTELGQRSFEVTSPAPSVSLLEPDNVSAASSGFTLKVEGADFQPPTALESSNVYWNGAPRPTTFVNDGELDASISAADIAEQGTAQITVKTGDTLVSDPVTFTITAPLPAITSLEPASVVEDTGSFSLKVIGGRFASNAAVLWTNGDGEAQQLSTSFVSSTQLEATVPATLITTPGSYPVAVTSNGTTSAAEILVVDAATSTTDSPSIGAATNGASFTGGVSPGGIAAIFGANLADATESATSVPLPTTLAGVQVLVAGVPAPLYYVSPSQINFQVPFETSPGDAVSVEVIRDGVAGVEATMLIKEYALGIFFYQREPGVQDPIITHIDGSLVTPSHPATPGETVTVWATGVGGLENPPPTGAASPQTPLAQSATLPQVILAGSSAGAYAEAKFVGLAPGYVGLIQMNIQLPSNRPPDPALKLGIRFHPDDNYLLVPIAVAQN